MTAHTLDDVEVIDLDALTTDELLVERDDVQKAISRISVALQTQPGRPPAPEDESPAWRAYRDWRRRARLALDFKRQELIDIKACLRERQDTHAATARLKAAAGEPVHEYVLGEERYARLLETLASETEDTMLLRAWRIVRHALAGSDTLPDWLDEFDRETLVAVGVHMRQTYGGHLKKFIDSPDGGLA